MAAIELRKLGIFISRALIKLETRFKKLIVCFGGLEKH